VDKRKETRIIMDVIEHKNTPPPANQHHTHPKKKPVGEDRETVTRGEGLSYSPMQKGSFIVNHTAKGTGFFHTILLLVTIVGLHLSFRQHQ